MAFDPQVQVIIDQLLKDDYPEYGSLSPDEHRRMFEETVVMGFGAVPAVPYEDQAVPGPAGPIPVRVYRPESEVRPGLMVYLHGGGWVLGGLTTVHGICSTWARDAACMIVSVDYRRAPENCFPAAHEDAWAVLEWAAAHAEELGARPGALAIGGDSAGGNMAATLARWARDRGLPLALQLLLYPNTDAAMETESYRPVHPKVLSRKEVGWFWDQYMPEGEVDRFQPDASPARAEDLAGVAPAFVLAAEYDPLVDEDKAYAEKLERAGVPVTYRCYPGQIHGFLRMVALVDRAKEAHADISAALREAFGTAAIESVPAGGHLPE